MRKTLKFKFILFCLVLSVACGSSDLSIPKAEAPAKDPLPAKETEPGSIRIKSFDGGVLADISEDNRITFSGKTLSGHRKNAEKVIYSVDGKEICEVKAKDSEGFKVRDLSGTLLWKIKIQDSKIKISDNEENQNPFEIKKREDGAKVERNGKKLGEVKFNPVSQKIKVKDSTDKEVFTSRTTKQSQAYGVLLLNEIKEEHKFIIMAEILSRNL